MIEPQGSDQKKDAEAIRFLERDFSQCFQQMRHYDGQILDICKFAFTGYIGVVGATLTLYKYGAEKAIDYTLPSAAVLCLAAVFGSMLLALMVRNRIYFVFIARYINEHRGFFLTGDPLGFTNKTHMYIDSEYPLYFNWMSSQSWLMYTMALLNASMLGLVGFLVCADGLHWWCLIPAVSALVGQLLAVVGYLRAHDHKSAANVHGKDKELA